MAIPRCIGRAALRRAGVAVAPAEVGTEARDGRLLVRLPDGRLAWFAEGDRGRQIMERERQVLRLIRQRCTFAVPHVVFESDDGVPAKERWCGRTLSRDTRATVRDSGAGAQARATWTIVRGHAA
jgi:hypothetical protein